MGTMQNEIRRALQKKSSKKKATILQRFFKTGPGEYGEGDVFIGVTVPAIRAIVKTYQTVSVAETVRLLHSPVHEERLCALLIMVKQFEKGDERIQKKICTAYLKNTTYINNWDLVDLTAHHIVGAYVWKNPKKMLDTLARSKNLWERRIAIIATFYFIRHNRFIETLRLARILRNDTEDLIHKAVGWMLREVGKRDQVCEEHFLRRHYKTMPRTMLRYAIERFPEKKKQAYLKGKI